MKLSALFDTRYSNKFTSPKVLSWHQAASFFPQIEKQLNEAKVQLGDQSQAVHALQAISYVLESQKLFENDPQIGANSIWLYTENCQSAMHILLDHTTAKITWLGSLNHTGKKLVEYGLAQSVARGATKATVKPIWGSSGFYERLGFQDLGTGYWHKTLQEQELKRRPYRYNYRGEKAEYNPDFFDLEDDSLEDEHGKPLATKDKLVPKPHLRHELNLTKNPNFVYRGMSNPEFQQIKKTGKIQSLGGYNLAGQEGLTYFSTDPNSAEFYAHAFAPWAHKANWDNPAWVVAVNKPDPAKVVKVPGTASHEVGVTGSVDASEIQQIYRGKAVQYHPGVPDQVAPSAWLHWEMMPLSVIKQIKEDLNPPLPSQVYHVSRKRNRGSIRKLGLTPKTREHTHILRLPGIFAFETLEQADDWAWNWSHETQEPMDIWQIEYKNPQDWHPDPSREMQEIYDCWVTYKPIPPSELRLIKTQPVPQGFFYKTSNPKKQR